MNFDIEVHPGGLKKSLIAAFCTRIDFLSAISFFFISQNYTPMTHGFPTAAKDFSGFVECPPSTNFHLFEMQAKPELRCNIEDGSEEVDMDYMLEMPYECENGNEAVSLYVYK